MLNGELAVLERSIALRRTVGMPIGAGELGLRVADRSRDARRALDARGRCSSARTRRAPSSPQLAKQDASATIDIEVTENGLLPQLDAALSLGPIGQRRHVRRRARRTSSSSRQLAGHRLADVLALAASVRRARPRARSCARRARRSASTRSTSARRSRRRWRARSRRSSSRSGASCCRQRAIDLANENIRIETDRFNLGKSTNFDVLNRLEELRQAELRKAQAMIDWHKAEAVVQALTGDILPSYGVTID